MVNQTHKRKWNKKSKTTQLNFLKSKFQEVVVTKSGTSYEGSITIDPELLAHAQMYPFEKVDVNDSTNGNRITSYILPGKTGSGEIQINGAASRLIKKGDKIHILAFKQIPESEYKKHQPIIVYTKFEDNKNIHLRTTVN